jgi:hypothetical protein
MEPIDYNTIFDYNDGGDAIPKDAFRISPSGVEKFFSDKTNWYRENLLGQDKKFTGSTSTVLGTCVHTVAEVVANAVTNKTPHDSELLAEKIAEYIDTYEDNEDYDTSKIHSLWKNMAEPLVKDFVLQANTIATEDFISHELLPGIFVGGSYDAITSSAPTDTMEMVKAGTNVGLLTVRDYKTASKKPSSFSYAYKLQAYTYAYILRQQGINIQEVELCYAVQPTKTIGVRTVQFKLPFDQKAYEFIEGILFLIADSIDAWNNWPEGRYLLCGDYRLKIH